MTLHNSPAHCPTTHFSSCFDDGHLWQLPLYTRDKARTIAADSYRGLIHPVPTPWRLPCAGISPTMSLARQPRPSWSVSSSHLVDCCLATTLGKPWNSCSSRSLGCSRALDVLLAHGYSRPDGTASATPGLDISVQSAVSSTYCFLPLSASPAPCRIILASNTNQLVS